MTIEHSMSAASFEWHLQRLGMSVYEAAPFLGISLRHCYRFMPTPKFPEGEYVVPIVVARLLRLMVKYRVDPDAL